MLQVLPRHLYDNAIELYNANHSFNEVWHSICSAHVDEMLKQKISAYKPHPVSQKNLYYLIVKKGNPGRHSVSLMFSLLM